MDLTKHCQLCEHQLYDIHTGSKCALTNERPNFSVKCPNIKLDVKYQARIKAVNIEYELVRRTKAISLGNFFFFGAVSIAFFTGGYLLGSYAFDKGVISTVPLIVMSVGLFVFPMAAGPLNKYRQGIKIARAKKSELDSLLSAYNIQYTIDVFVHTDVHGNQDITTNLNFQRKHVKRQ